jgi:putative sterol carrier protein
VAVRTTDTTREFFDGLATRGHEPLLARAEGTLRFDLVDPNETEHWLVRVDRGAVEVSRGHTKADVILFGDRSVFDGIVSGRTNAMAAVLRGAIRVEGDLSLAMLFQRVFPGPPPAAAG